MAKLRAVLLAGLLVGACAPLRNGEVAGVEPERASDRDTTLQRGGARGGGQGSSHAEAPRSDASGSVAGGAGVAGAARAPDADGAASRAPSRGSASDVATQSPTRAAEDSILVALGGDAAESPMLALDPYANHSLVERYVGLFSGTARTRMGERLTRATRYEAMIREKLRRGGIPEEFLYLALIESGYDPDAYSSAAAVGMWQFMTATARGVGLRVDWWIDDRRDAVRATDAAVKHLGSLRDQFGSMYLAAAAYNGGAGRVSRGLSQLARELEGAAPDDQFFTLASRNVLRAETKNYVPQLIAAALIGREPERYGVTVDTLDPFVYDSAMVPAATSLPVLAAVCRVGVDAIVDLNRNVLRGVTAPDAPMLVRLPVGCGESLGDTLAAMPDSLRVGVHRHPARTGETATALAKRLRVTTATLRRYNPKLPTRGTLTSKTTVLVPTPEVVAAARNVPDPAIERYGVASGATYMVRRGDTLSGIAQRHNTTVSALKRMNNLRSDRILAGQKLRVRG